MSESNPVTDEIVAIKTYLGAVLDTLRTGYMPDITGLEKRVSDLCRDIQLADDDVQKQCAPMLADLLKDLDACENDMREWHKEALKKGSGDGA